MEAAEENHPQEAEVQMVKARLGQGGCIAPPTLAEADRVFLTLLRCTHVQRIDVCVLVGCKHQRQAPPSVLYALQLLLDVELLLGPVQHRNKFGGQKTLVVA